MSTPLDNLGGIISLDVVLAANLSQYLNSGGRVSLTLAAGKAWENLPFTYGSLQPTEDVTESEAGELFTQKVVFRMPGISETTTALLNAKRNVRLVAKLETDSGEFIILGSKEYPAVLTYRLIPGSAAADYSGYEVTISAKSTAPLGLLVL